MVMILNLLTKFFRLPPDDSETISPSWTTMLVQHVKCPAQTGHEHSLHFRQDRRLVKTFFFGDTCAPDAVLRIKEFFS